MQCCWWVVVVPIPVPQWERAHHPRSIQSLLLEKENSPEKRREGNVEKENIFGTLILVDSPRREELQRRIGRRGNWMCNRTEIEKRRRGGRSCSPNERKPHGGAWNGRRVGHGPDSKKGESSSTGERKNSQPIIHPIRSVRKYCCS